MIAKATIEVEENQYAQAIDDADRAVVEAPNDPEVYKVRAMARVHSAQYQNAIEDFSKALTFPADKIVRAHLLAQRGLAYSNLHEWKRALQDLSDAIALDPSEWNYVQRGKVYLTERECPDATDDYLHVLHKNDKSYDALVGLGYCAIREASYDQALKMFDKAVSISPDGAEALFQRGLVHLYLKQFEQAADDLQRSNEIRPTLLSQERLAEATRHLVMKKRPDVLVVMPLQLPKDFEELLKLGYARLENGEPDEGVRCFSEAVRRKPNDARARRYLAYAFLQQGNDSDAIEQFGALQALHADTEQDRSQLGAALKRTTFVTKPTSAVTPARH